MIFDRIYGRLSFPRIIRKLLDCPGLLRLREIRMSSVPFINFPSFSSVNRFEHSLGVCHLAQLASEALNLSITEKLELMSACLYHDVATPPFAHATEEILNEYFGFDHEVHLHDLLIGKTNDLGIEKSQIYMGKSLKLLKTVQSKEGRKLGLDIFRIADIAIGKGKLGPLLKGEIDLDNIDNVIRAATAMGITSCSPRDAEAIARSYDITQAEVALHESEIGQIKRWQQIRYMLYDAIYGDVEDFSLQTMLKSAINLLVDSTGEGKFLPIDWRLTDEELIHYRIMRDEEAKKIMERIMLNKPYPCKGVFSFSGPESCHFVIKHLSKIEKLATEYFRTTCLANYTLDKRRRTLTYPLLTLFEKSRSFLDQEKTQTLFLYIFSTRKKDGYYKEPDTKFICHFQSLLPSAIDLKPLKRVLDGYPHLVEMELSE